MAAPPQLDGKVAIVTGASRGIGLAIAQALGRAGARVAITGRDAATLSRAAAGLPSESATLVADNREPDQIARAVDDVAARWGRIDVLVNNAGVGLFKPAVDLSLAEWRELLDINLTAPFIWVKAVLPHMHAAGGGSIVNISSLASVGPFAGGTGYCASKAGLNAFGDALRDEVRDRGVRVTTVLPGSVATSFGGRDGAPGAEWKVLPEHVADAVLAVLTQPAQTLVSRVEVRPARPPRR